MYLSIFICQLNETSNDSEMSENHVKWRLIKQHWYKSNNYKTKLAVLVIHLPVIL